MKRSVSAVVLFVLGTYTHAWAAEGSWSTGWLTAPSNQILALANAPSDADVVYGSTNSAAGVYRTINGGSNWTKASTGLDGVGVYSIAVHPSVSSTAFAVSWSGTLYKTTDGMSWAAFGAGLPSEGTEVVVIDPTDPSTMYAGSDGVYKSIDAGETWERLPNGPGAGMDMAIAPSDPQTVYVSHGPFTPSGLPHLYRTENGGGTWTEITPTEGWRYQERICSLAVDPTTDTTLYMGTEDGTSDVYKTTDGGATWSRLGNGLPGAPYDLCGLVVDPTNPAALYAGINAGNPSNAFDGVYRTVNGGLSWSAMNSGLEHRNVVALTIDDTGLQLHAGTALDGVWDFEVDVTPPDTEILSGPQDVEARDSAVFEFASTEPGSEFDCRLDRSPPEPCTSPWTYGDVAEGQHLFEVWATDPSGNTDASPASREWVVDPPSEDPSPPPEDPSPAPSPAPVAPSPAPVAGNAANKGVTLTAKPRKVPEGSRTTLVVQVFPCAGHEGDLIQFFRGFSHIATKASDSQCKAVHRQRLRRAATFWAVSPMQDVDDMTGESNRVRVRII